MHQSTIHKCSNPQCTKYTMHQVYNAQIYNAWTSIWYEIRLFWEDDEISLRDSYQLAQALSGEVATTSISSHCPVLL